MQNEFLISAEDSEVIWLAEAIRQLHRKMVDEGTVSDTIHGHAMRVGMSGREINSLNVVAELRDTIRSLRGILAEVRQVRAGRGACAGCRHLKDGQCTDPEITADAPVMLSITDMEPTGHAPICMSTTPENGAESV